MIAIKQVSFPFAVRKIHSCMGNIGKVGIPWAEVTWAVICCYLLKPNLDSLVWSDHSALLKVLDQIISVHMNFYVHCVMILCAKCILCSRLQPPMCEQGLRHVLINTILIWILQKCVNCVLQLCLGTLRISVTAHGQCRCAARQTGCNTFHYGLTLQPNLYKLIAINC